MEQTQAYIKKRWLPIYLIILSLLAISNFILLVPILLKPAPVVTITSPGEGAQVHQSVTVQGTASNVPDEQKLWLLVQVAKDYSPLTGPIDIASNGTWSANASLEGPFWGPFGTKKSFGLYAVLADQNGSAALSRASGKSLPISLPDGVKVKSQVQLVRVATRITITSPGVGDQVHQSVTVQGTASDIPPDKELWLLVQSGGVNGYFPQGDATNPNPIVVSSDGQWNVTARIGELADSGKRFVLRMALVDQKSLGRSAIDQYFAESKKTGKYTSIDPLPAGIELIGDEVQVVRFPPKVTITSPVEGSSIPVQITVQGTASDIPPDKELWLLVQSGGVNGYFPQGDATNPNPIVVSSDGQWNVTAYVGGPTDPRGMKFVLYMVLVDKNSPDRAAIDQYFAKGHAIDSYSPIYPQGLPEGIQLVAQITVRRA